MLPWTFSFLFRSLSPQHSNTCFVCTKSIVKMVKTLAVINSFRSQNSSSFLKFGAPTGPHLAGWLADMFECSLADMIGIPLPSGLRWEASILCLACVLSWISPHFTTVQMVPMSATGGSTNFQSFCLLCAELSVSNIGLLMISTHPHKYQCPLFVWPHSHCNVHFL